MEAKIKPQDVTAFWVDEVGPQGWYEVSPEVDRQIERRFRQAWQGAHDRQVAPWFDTAQEALASAVLLDQFPRNMFRGSPKAFATDAVALETVRAAIEKGWDAAIDGPQRQFFYLPFSHSEELAVQDEGVAHVKQWLPDGSTLLHARAHRKIIADFGRFPFRNKALGRTNSGEEQAFLDAGAYGAVVREMQR